MSRRCTLPLSSSPSTCDWLCPLPTAASRSRYGAQPGFMTFSPAVSPPTHPPSNLPPTSLCLLQTSSTPPGCPCPPHHAQNHISRPSSPSSPDHYEYARDHLKSPKILPHIHPPQTEEGKVRTAQTPGIISVTERLAFLKKIFFYFFSSSE